MNKFLLLGLSLAALLVACPQANVPASVSISPQNTKVAIGLTRQFTAQALNAAGQPIAGAAITFSSSQTSIASVDANGLATGAAIGLTEITASVAGTSISAKTNLSVLAAPTQANWSTNVQTEAGNNGKQISFICPAKPVSVGPVYGTDVYTDDSPICVAALHAGKITNAGGTFTLEIRPGQASYTGSTRNGITSSSYGQWFASYVFVD